MSQTLYERATHRDGPILWSGVDSKPSVIEQLKKDMSIELAQVLSHRSSVLEPAKVGVPSLVATAVIGPIFGNGFKMGSASVAHLDVGSTGAQKDGSLLLTSAGGANDQLYVVGPPAFGPATGKDLKFYFKGSIGDVDAQDVAIGMAHDDANSATTFPDLHVDTTGAISVVDGIIFHRAAAAASATMSFSVYDNNSNTNSTQTVTFPATIDDNVEFECGFVVHGLTSITVYMKVGSAETVQRIAKVSGTTLDLLTASLLKMGPACGFRHAGAAAETMTIKALAATQPL